VHDPRSDDVDVSAAVAAARSAQPAWATLTPVERGRLLRELAFALQARRDELADSVVEETGKPRELALGRPTPRSRWASSSRAREAVVRPHDDVGDAEPDRHGDALSRRRRGADRLVQHAAAELRVEAFPAVFCGTRPC
jgi:acyl-CoA reductase-like NAD-dependent aldehyde dehydrogenase